MFSMLSNLKVRTKLIVMLLVFGILPLIGTMPFIFHQLSKVSNDALNNQKSTAITVNDVIDRNLFERYGDAQSFALNPLAADNVYWNNFSSSNALVNLMNAYMKNYGMYHLMMLVDPNGKLLAVNTADETGRPLDTKSLYEKNYKDAPWLQKALHKEFLTGKGASGTVVEQPGYNPDVATLYHEDGFTITLAAPVYDTGGKIIAVWANSFDFDIIDNIIAKMYNQEKARGLANTKISLLDGKGNILVDYDTSNFENGVYKRNQEVINKINLVEKGFLAAQEAVKGGSGGLVENDSRKGIEEAIGYAHSEGIEGYPGLGWSTLVRTPEADAFSTTYSIEHTLFIIIAITALLIALFGYILGNKVAKPMRNAASNMQALAQGNTIVELGEDRGKDEMGQMSRSLADLKESVVNNIRLKLALDNCTANIMMADVDFNITYLNSAVSSFLQEAEKDIQKELPRFSVANLIGSNIDVFHKNPSHQRNMLEKLSSPYKTSIQVGGRSFNLVANPIFDQNKKRLGTVVEWQDGTAIGLTDALNRSQAIIEFLTDGTIQTANSNFLNAMGYTLDEIKGKHHSMFIDSAYRGSAEYRKFWEDLNRGEAQSGEFKRIGKGGKEIWINASYNPIMDLKGKVVRVVKTASDITQMVTIRTENEIGMNEAVKVLSGIAEGKLTDKMTHDYKGTFADIKIAVNATVDRLYDMVKRIIEAAQSVNSAATEIAAGSTDLSQRTEEQASSLEETAASMEQITGTVKQNSSNAANANDLSGKANSVASDGGRVVEDAITAMNSIEKSSKKISDIIGVIDEIAFQTNLLALNAAVEAARAGDAGKGFAVVASEVRSLAGRSASASKEIKTLINESAQQVQSGATLVNQAGETLKGIVSSVKQVSSIVSEIASASQEQATGIDEINAAITQMDEVTQQNAALVEENTAAAQSMVEQARELEKLMSFFSINEQDEDESGDHPNIVALNTSHNSSKAKSAAPKTASKSATRQKPPVRTAAKPAKAAGTKQYDKDWQEF